MIADKFLTGNERASVFMKPAPLYLTASFLRMANDQDCTESFYCAQFNKDIDDKMKKMVWKYHPHIDDMMISQQSDSRKFTYIPTRDNYLIVHTNNVSPMSLM